MEITKTIPLKEYQKTLTNLELPVIVTRKGIPAFAVLSIGEFEKLNTIALKVHTSSPKPKVITPEVLDQFKRIETCAWIGCNKEVVGHDKINGRGFCKEHI